MNALLDKEFLKQLDNYNSREVYARLTALSIDELPIDLIEGKVTGGSINIDGASAVRRTCSLQLIAEDIDLNNFYWGLNNKFKVEIGLKNFINSKYPDIIWFPQGVYVITSFNASLSANRHNISISGKDKMCLLTGDIAGSLPVSVDFGVEVLEDGSYSKIPIKRIIKEMLHTYGSEPYHNIIINDLDDKGLELLEYRGEDPIYLRYDINEGIYDQMYFGHQTCYIKNSSGQYRKEIEIKDLESNGNGGKYNSRVEDLFNSETNPATKVTFVENGVNEYTISKIEFGQTAGYRLTELTYAGELISNIGESITSILDKLVKMLGNFEYFYDLNGRFIFQEKKTYLQTSYDPIKTVTNDTISYYKKNAFDKWIQISKADYDICQTEKKISYGADKEIHVENSAYTDSNAYYFDGNNLISSFSNAPNINNIKNDYTVWGERKGVTGAKLPIHFRYAIHKKPVYYKNFDGEVYTSFDIENVVSLPNRDLLPECLKTGFEGEWWNIFDWAERYKILTGDYPSGRVATYSNRTCKLDLNKYFPPSSSSTRWNPSRPLFLFDVNPQGQLAYTAHNPSRDGQSPMQSCGHDYLWFVNNSRNNGWIGYIYDPTIPDDVNVLYKKVDWREIIYQMALDYYKHNQDDDFYSVLSRNNPDYYPTGITGYEQFYTDIQQFWRQLYNPKPDMKFFEYYYGASDEQRFLPYDEKGNDIDDLLVREKYTQLNSSSKVDRSKVMVLKQINGVYELQKLIDTIALNYEFDENGKQIQTNKYYVTANNELGYKELTQNTYQRVEKKEIYVRQQNGYFIHILDTVNLNSSCYLKEEIPDNETPINVFNLPSQIQKLYYYQGYFNRYYPTTPLGLDGQPIEGAEKVRNYITYYYYDYDFFLAEDLDHSKQSLLYWNKTIEENPDLLNFWLDFLDSYTGDEKEAELSQYTISAIGDRPKAVNDSEVKSIYYRNVPNVIFTTNINKDSREKSGYVFLQLHENQTLNLFSISAQGKSAKSVVDELLYNHTYYTDSINITAIPVYYLQPNTRISVRDDSSKINGEYIVNRISLPLTYNGQMTIQAIKAPQRFN